MKDDWKFDPAAERARARVRFALFMAVLALVAGSLVSNADHALMAPLLQALAGVFRP